MYRYLNKVKKDETIREAITLKASNFNKSLRTLARPSQWIFQRKLYQFFDFLALATRLAIRDATAPAATPLSMLTTVKPSEQA